MDTLLLPISPRTKWSITNETEQTLKLLTSTLDAGLWTCLPPAELSPRKTIRFVARSEAFRSAEGTVTYASDDAGEVTFWFSNPAAGPLNGTLDYAIRVGEFSFTWKNPCSGSADYEVTEPPHYVVRTDRRLGYDQILNSRIIKVLEEKQQ
ncbi:hypothetical protein [Bradyrhizobium sp. DOA9]|uniref:hypothetical protein n=1 Tax=Bradyrhizobium sp. DOA9 TaxID=1126627 RepID=UPI000468BE2B|nr:hypothetical protein [Bradyrhizobium sp. DOA9]